MPIDLIIISVAFALLSMALPVMAKGFKIEEDRRKDKLKDIKKKEGL